MPNKAPEWLSADIQEFYSACQGNIRAIQRTIREKRGVDIAYMTISNRMDDLGLERPRKKSKPAKTSLAEEPPMNIQLDPLPTDPVIVLAGQMRIDDTDTPPDQEASLSAIADIVPVNHQVDGPLSPVELQTLEHYERIIDQGIKTFVQVGQALLTIREERLYRETYTTFETYLRERWNLDRSYAHRMIDAAQVVENLLPIGNILPVNESQTRPLTSLSPAQQVEVWKEVVETAPAGKVTAQHVKDTVKRATATGTTPPKTTGPKPPKPFDVQGITTKIKDLYMDWLKHCETEDALETAQFFLNTLSDLAQGRGMQLQRQ